MRHRAITLIKTPIPHRPRPLFLGSLAAYRVIDCLRAKIRGRETIGGSRVAVIVVNRLLSGREGLEVDMDERIRCAATRDDEVWQELTT